MSVRFPAMPKSALGVGIDLPWSKRGGFTHTPAGPRPTERVLRYLAKNPASHHFFSWQPLGRGRLAIGDYAPAWDALMSSVTGPAALHHTTLNLGAMPDRERRDELVAFTNALIRRYGFRWVNEDLGIWSLRGKPLPYPLPPFLTPEGLAVSIANCRFWQEKLDVPLLVEFPGFSEGISLRVGTLDAYDFFREVAVRSESPVTLDIGHLLSWRWLIGHRGESLYADLHRLPLEHCFEIHLSGCLVRGDAWVDAHHGILRDEQLTLLERLLPLCPNLRAITYEDPRFSDDGDLIPLARPGVERLRSICEKWLAVPTVSPAAPRAPTAESTSIPARSCDTRQLEERLYRLLHHAPTATAFLSRPDREGPFASVRANDLREAVRLVRRRLWDRRYLGVGNLAAMFPGTLASWQQAHPEDSSLDALAAMFLASPEADAWREVGTGLLAEEAFARFADRIGLPDADARRAELLGATVRTLGLHPDPGFAPPHAFRRHARGWIAVDGDRVYATRDGTVAIGVTR